MIGLLLVPLLPSLAWADTPRIDRRLAAEGVVTPQTTTPPLVLVTSPRDREGRCLVCLGAWSVTVQCGAGAACPSLVQPVGCPVPPIQGCAR